MVKRAASVIWNYWQAYSPIAEGPASSIDCRIVNELKEREASAAKGSQVVCAPAERAAGRRGKQRQQQQRPWVHVWGGHGGDSSTAPPPCRSLPVLHNFSMHDRDTASSYLFDRNYFLNLHATHTRPWGCTAVVVQLYSCSRMILDCSRPQLLVLLTVGGRRHGAAPEVAVDVAVGPPASLL